MVDLAGTPDLSTRRAFLAGIAILASYNVARGLGAFGGFSDVSLLGLLCVFVVLARATGLDRTALGLAREDVRRGAVYGVVAFLITATVLLVVRVVPATTDFLDDSRADVSGPRLLFEIAIPMLLLTVIPEEFIFRGVLLAWGRSHGAIAGRRSRRRCCSACGTSRPHSGRCRRTNSSTRPPRPSSASS